MQRASTGVWTCLDEELQLVMEPHAVRHAAEERNGHSNVGSREEIHAHIMEGLDRCEYIIDRKPAKNQVSPRQLPGQSPAIRH